MKTTVSKLVDNYLKYNRDIKLTINSKDYNRIIPISERIEDICWHFQSDTIIGKIGHQPLPNPKDINKTIQELNLYHQKFDELLYSGCGRELLIKKLSFYANPHNIIVEIDNHYKKNPIEAGNFAEKYISYNRFINLPGLDISPDEPTETVDLCENNINFRYDLLDYNAIYEFTVTKSENLESVLNRKLLQIYLYDFLHRIKYFINYHRGLVIEIYLIDKKEILQFGAITTGPFKKMIIVDKNILKDIFKINKLNNLLTINKIIDENYDNIKPRLESEIEFDEWLVNNRK